MTVLQFVRKADPQSGTEAGPDSEAEGRAAIEAAAKYQRELKEKRAALRKVQNDQITAGLRTGSRKPR